MNGSSSEAQDLMEWFCGSPKTRRVPQEAVFGTECVFRTVEGCFWYRVPSKEQGKGPPETSSALTGPKKWRKGPERTKRAESGSEAICCRCGTSNFTKERGRPFRRPYVSIRPIRHHILNLTLITAGLSLSLSSRPVLSMTYLLSGSVVSLCPYSR